MLGTAYHIKYALGYVINMYHVYVIHHMHEINCHQTKFSTTYKTPDIVLNKFEYIASTFATSTRVIL